MVGTIIVELLDILVWFQFNTVTRKLSQHVTLVKVQNQLPDHCEYNLVLLIALQPRAGGGLVQGGVHWGESPDTLTHALTT